MPAEPTVRKYLAKEDLSAVPSVRKPRASVIDPYLPVIEQWLAEDRANWRKQRHTATRIWERLRDEHGAEVSLSTVTRAVARLRREFAAERDEAFMDLVWHPGEAQADFGEVDVLLRGVVQRMHHFVPGFPYSNVGLVQSVPGENAECTCLALRNLFEWLGGVPERIVFDNAAGVGHKGYGEREPRLTHLFQAFQAHYGFDCSFCNPYSGHEKGAVESKAGYGAAQAVRAPAERMEPGELQRRAAGPVPGAGHETALPQGHGGTWPVLRGPCGAAAVAREAFRRRPRGGI